MKSLLISVAAVASMSLAGCNTIAGLGRDVERSGEKLQDASIKVRADWRAARDRHETEYEAARRQCDSGSAAERDACRDRARTQYSSRMNESRTTYRRDDLRSASEAERREDAFENARERCNAMRGSEEDRCIEEARRSYLRAQ